MLWHSHPFMSKHLNPIWIPGVPRGSILVNFLFSFRLLSRKLLLKIVDWQAHNVIRCVALWACRSAVLQKVSSQYRCWGLSISKTHCGQVCSLSVSVPSFLSRTWWKREKNVVRWFCPSWWCDSKYQITLFSHLFLPINSVFRKAAFVQE